MEPPSSSIDNNAVINDGQCSIQGNRRNNRDNMNSNHDRIEPSDEDENDTRDVQDIDVNNDDGDARCRRAGLIRDNENRSSNHRGNDKGAQQQEQHHPQNDGSNHISTSLPAIAGKEGNPHYQDYLQYQQQSRHYPYQNQDLQQQHNSALATNASSNLHHHNRMDSEDLYNTMKNNMHNHYRNSSSMPNFYESDIDTDNGSIIFNKNSVLRGSGNINDHMRLESMGSTDSYQHLGSSPGGGHHVHSDQQQQQRQPSEDQYAPSHQYHLPYHQRKQLQVDNDHHGVDNNDSNGKNDSNRYRNELSTINNSQYKGPNANSLSPPLSQYHIYTNNNNKSSPPTNSKNQLLPMHRSSQNQQRISSVGYHHDRTFTGDSTNYYSPKSEADSPSPPPHQHSMFSHNQQQSSRQYNHHQHSHHNHQPPLHPKHTRQHSSTNPRWNRHEYGNEEARKAKTTALVPAIHIRADSTGSVSSLGSLTGGASSISRRNANGFPDRSQHVVSYNDHHDLMDDHRGGGQGHESIGRQGSGFLSSILGSISVTSCDAGSVNSLDSEKDELYELNQRFLNKAEKEKAKQMRSFQNKNVDNKKRVLPDLVMAFGGRPTIRSISPGARSQRSHRPKLPSIDNDDWSEDNNKRHGKSQRRFPRSKKQMTKGYGSMNQREKIQSKKRECSKRKKDMHLRKKDPHLDTTRRLTNMNHDDSSCFSDSGSDSGDSSYSSDFTSNQKDDDSSVYTENGASSSDNFSYDEDSQSEQEHEGTSLLQPHGISTGETPTPNHYQKRRYRSTPEKRLHRSPKIRRNRSSKTSGKKSRHQVYNKRSSNYRYSRSRHNNRKYAEPEITDSSSGSYDNEVYMEDLPERERERLIQQWKSEYFRQEEARRKQKEEEYCHNRFKRWLSARTADFVNFVSNLPLTIGAVALAIVTLGIVWFKFSEQMLSICTPVHYHSKECHFEEFPGCMNCDTSDYLYQLALKFHLTCSVIAGLIALLIVIKICIARQLFIDEMNSPTTASPAGLLCMTLVCVFAGKGQIGEAMVSIASTSHFFIAIWFIYMAGAYNILPDPSWYPNTVGIGITASKMWLYHPIPGHMLMATSISLYILFFPISLVRVTLNKKLSASVTWIQMSAPAAALCGLTVMGQPSYPEEYPDINLFQRMHRMYYVPAMHFIFATAIIGVISSFQSLIARWDSFSKKPFSPAHAAFCFPALAHTNAIQNYRSAIRSFSTLGSNKTFMRIINTYWIIFLGGSTIATLIISARFFYMLPSWTKVDVDGEIEPPAPNETQMADVILAGHPLHQDFVSPAVLQANEVGALIRVPGRTGESAQYKRTRRVTALGFEPIMELMELQAEREALLNWVRDNPPRQRKRTLSVPGITSNIANFGSNNRGVYDGGMVNIGSAQRRARAQTSDWNYRYI